jgi:hypothetical protein
MTSTTISSTKVKPLAPFRSFLDARRIILVSLLLVTFM